MLWSNGRGVEVVAAVAERGWSGEQTDKLLLIIGGPNSLLHKTYTLKLTTVSCLASIFMSMHL